MKSFLLASPSLLLLACGVRENKSQVDYLGQTPPDSIVELFAPGIASTDSFEHSSPVFSPDGRVVLWNIVRRNNPACLLEATYEDGKWSSPHKPSFGAELADDYYPSSLLMEGGYSELSQYENDTDLSTLKDDKRWAQPRKKLK